VERWEVDFIMNTGTSIEEASLLIALMLKGLHVKQFILIVHKNSVLTS
jgi:hypothetical protein